MKSQRAGLMIALLLLIQLSCSKQRASIGTTPGSDSNVKVRVTERIGPVFSGQGEFEHIFQVKNTRSYPVQITRHKASCTCSAVEYPSDFLSPGDEMPLTLKLRPIYGRQSTTYLCQLETDDALSPEWTYRLEVEFYPPATAEPDHVLLESVTEDTVVSVSVQTYAEPGSTPNSLSLLNQGEFEFEGKCVEEPNVDVLKDGAVRASYALRLRPMATAFEIGLHKSTILFALASGHRLEIPIVWEVEGKIATTPSRLFFILQDGNEQASKVVSLVSRDAAPFRITSLESDNDSVTCQWSENATPSAEQSVMITVHRNESQSFRGRLRLMTDTITGIAAELPYSVFIKSLTNDRSSTSNTDSGG